MSNHTGPGLPEIAILKALGSSISKSVGFRISIEYFVSFFANATVGPSWSPNCLKFNKKLGTKSIQVSDFTWPDITNIGILSVKAP
jgi:hypothetical protein